MPWERKTIMSQRVDFVRFYEQNGNMSEAARRFDITRKTGYKWWKRFQKNGLKGLEERSRAPKSSPNKTPDKMEQQVLKVRRGKKGSWGGRKIETYLIRQGYKDVPAPSTITEILRRHGKLDPDECEKRKPFQRFEKEEPNELWQMDFKGHFEIEGGRCHPLTILDDHSRYSLCLKACLNETRQTVHRHLLDLFERNGLPRQIMVDNGAPWGHDFTHRHTRLTVWIMERGVWVGHSRPYHPQTLGKDERFHRTFKQAVQPECEGKAFEVCQPVFDEWRGEYNNDRPHEALNYKVPADRYRRSEREIPTQIHPWDYSNDFLVRKVDINGHISFKNKRYRVGKGFVKKRVGLKETEEDGIMDIYFRRFKVGHLSLKKDL